VGPSMGKGKRKDYGETQKTKPGGGAVFRNGARTTKKRGTRKWKDIATDRKHEPRTGGGGGGAEGGGQDVGAAG